MESMPKVPKVMDANPTQAEERPFFEMPVALINGDVQLLDEQVKSMMGVSENLITIGNQTPRRSRICKVCGKEGSRANILTHIEANHIDTSDVSHSCDICGKSSRSRNALRVHKASQHQT